MGSSRIVVNWRAVAAVLYASILSLLIGISIGASIVMEAAVR